MLQFKDIIWETSQATLQYHPSKISSEIECISTCIISDDRDHNATAVHKFIEVIMSFLKTKILVKHVHYFSDGAASQYKNYKNLCNLCFHVVDHQVTVAWVFFCYQSWQKPM